MIEKMGALNKNCLLTFLLFYFSLSDAASKEVKFFVSIQRNF